MLHHPKLSFFHYYLVSLGAQLPPKPAAKATPGKEVKPNKEAVKLTIKKAKQADKEEEEMKKKEAKSTRFKIKKQAEELARSSLARPRPRMSRSC